jgi:glycine cleavage system H protein
VIDGYEFPGDLWYHPQEHLWIRAGAPDEAGRLAVTVGLDAIGVEALGDVVYVQLLEAGLSVTRGQAIGSLEAEKMVRPVLAPVSGVLLEVNDALLTAPRLLNTDCYGSGWVARMAASDWEAESRGLLRARADVAAWVTAELRSHEERR